MIKREPTHHECNTEWFLRDFAAEETVAGYFACSVCGQSTSPYLTGVTGWEEAASAYMSAADAAGSAQGEPELGEELLLET